MFDFHQAKLEIYIPEDYLPALREALAAAGAGRDDHYDNCSAVTRVTGYWRPLAGAHPFRGEVGALCQAAECKVEVRCHRELLAAALAAVRRVHPYEEPVIDVIPLANHLYTLVDP